MTFSDASYSLMGFISRYLFTGYGMFTLLWVVSKVFRKNDTVLDGLDCIGNRIIAIAGLMFAIFWIVRFSSFYYSGGPEEEGLKKRLFGPYGYTLWIHPVVYLATTQLLWFGAIRRQKVIRLVIAFLLAFSIEKYIITVTSFHRDFEPDSWVGSNDGQEMLFYGLLGAIISGMVFTAITGLCYLIRQKLKTSAYGNA